MKNKLIRTYVCIAGIYQCALLYYNALARLMTCNTRTNYKRPD